MAKSLTISYDSILVYHIQQGLKTADLILQFFDTTLPRLWEMPKLFANQVI